MSDLEKAARMVVGAWLDPQGMPELCKAMEALRRALEQQPAEKPVATLWQHGETGRTRVTMPNDITDCDARWFKAADLYTRPQPAAHGVGLTLDDIWASDEIMALNADLGLGIDDWVRIVRAVEATKLHEKNGGVV